MSIRFVSHDPRTFPPKSRVFARARRPRMLSNEKMFFRHDVSNESEFRRGLTFPTGIIPDNTKTANEQFSPRRLTLAAI